LSLDIGNTRIKAAVFDGRKLLPESQTFDFNWHKAIQYKKKFPFTETIISSTRSGIGKLISTFSELGNIHILNHKTSVPVQVDYDTPKTLGPDRIAAICGANHMFKGENCLVVDAGTCITFDYIDHHQKFHGGNIAPGIQMRLKAMHEYTSKLPHVHKKHTKKLLGKTTQEALQNGACLGVAMEIEALYERLYISERQINIILTGGDALFLAENVKKEIFVVPNLVLIGLNEILLHNLEHEE
jgi:type III pantothenate kinase